MRAKRRNATDNACPTKPELRRQVLDSLIEDRAMLSFARDSGMRIDDAELDRTVANIATQNQMTMAQLRAQLAREGLDLARFRANMRDQMLIERVREREVAQRIRITDSEIDEFIEKQRGAVAGEVQYNIAQMLVTRGRERQRGRDGRSARAGRICTGARPRLARPLPPSPKRCRRTPTRTRAARSA